MIYNLPDVFYILTTIVLPVVSRVSLKCPQEGIAMTMDAPVLVAAFVSEEKDLSGCCQRGLTVF